MNKPEFKNEIAKIEFEIQKETDKINYLNEESEKSSLNLKNMLNDSLLNYKKILNILELK